jgi:hypothetical protein
VVVGNNSAGGHQPMRALFLCALFCSVSFARSSPSRPPGPIDGPTTCEEECKAQNARDDAVCDDRVLIEGDRGTCHQSVRARLDVCLRLCED